MAMIRDSNYSNKRQTTNHGPFKKFLTLLCSQLSPLKGGRKNMSIIACDFILTCMENKIDKVEVVGKLLYSIILESLISIENKDE